VQQVRFAKSNTAVDKKRVIGLAGRFRYSLARRVGEPVALAYDKVVKTETGV